MLARIALGAAIGLGVMVAGWVVALVVTEALRARYGWEVDYLTLAQVELVTLVGAPIVGGWYGWVRR